jgi:hypothetical protein
VLAVERWDSAGEFLVPTVLDHVAYFLRAWRSALWVLATGPVVFVSLVAYRGFRALCAWAQRSRRSHPS